MQFLPHFHRSACSTCPPLAHGLLRVSMSAIVNISGHPPHVSILRVCPGVIHCGWSRSLSEPHQSRPRVWVIVCSIAAKCKVGFWDEGHAETTVFFQSICQEVSMCAGRATHVHQARRDHKKLGLTQSNQGHKWFPTASGCGSWGYPSVTPGTGPVPTETPFPCQTPVARQRARSVRAGQHVWCASAVVHQLHGHPCPCMKP